MMEVIIKEEEKIESEMAILVHNICRMTVLFILQYLGYVAIPF